MRHMFQTALREFMEESYRERAVKAAGARALVSRGGVSRKAHANRALVRGGEGGVARLCRQA